MTQDLVDIIKLVDDKVKSCLPDEGNCPSKLVEAMNYAMSAGGKRIRPTLLYLSYKMVSQANALEAACEEAEKGIEYTKTIRATKGRASYLGDRSIGHQDPGATSATITLKTILEFLKG